MHPDERARLIDTLAAFPPRPEALVRDLPDDRLTATPLADEWSVAQAVHHLADSHMQGFIRMKLILTEDQPLLTPYSQPAFAGTADATHPALRESLDLLHGLHARWVRLLASLPDEAWARTGIGPQPNQVRTLDDILHTYANHGDAHLEQIRHVLAAGGAP